MPNVTPEESILIQSLALAECYIKLGEMEVQNDTLIAENLNRIFGPVGKQMTEMRHSVFQGQGTLVSVFYMFLVLPHEWAKNGIGDFASLKSKFSKPEAVAKKLAVVEEDYEDTDYGALRHFRNALAHGRIYGHESGGLVVEDQRNCQKYRAVYSMKSLGCIAQSLYETITEHLKSVMKKREAEA